MHSNSLPPSQIQPQRVSQIEEVIAALTSAQCETHDLLSKLDAQLQPVLVHSAEKSSSGEGQASPAGESPLHTELLLRLEYARGHNRRLFKMIEGLTL